MPVSCFNLDRPVHKNAQNGIMPAFSGPMTLIEQNRRRSVEKINLHRYRVVIAISSRA